MNAFAAPGGYLYVFTGMILNVEDESELAGVLAHELAHISQRHIARHMERAKLINIGSMLGVLAGALLGPGDAGSAMMYGALAGGQSAYLKYSREDEREADQVGINYLVEAGYRPQGLPESFEKIRRKRWLSGGSLPAYLSTHPDVEERIEYLYQRIGRYPDSITSRTSGNDKLRRIQTILRARYTDANEALLHFQKEEQQTDPCLSSLGRAIALDRLNRVNDANAAFEQALSCGGKDSLFLREAGSSYFLQGKFDQAAKLLNEAVLRNPKDLMAMFYYARLLSETDRTEQALPYMQRVMRTIPEDPEIHYYMGRIQGKKGDPFQAHLHLAYSSLYSNDQKMTGFHLEKVKHLARSEDEKQELKRFQETYKERAEFWGK